MLFPNQFVEVFLVSGSPEEREQYVREIISGAEPRIVLCPVQYRQDAITTFEYARDQGFHICTLWLNPMYGETMHDQ